MFDIFQQPWTLTGLAVFLLFIVFTIRSVFTEKPRRWLLLIPLATVALAFGLDRFVQTDLEKIHALLDTAAHAVQQEDYPTIQSILAPNYEDSRHSSRDSLVSEARRRLNASNVEKNKTIGATVQLAGPQATAVVTFLTRFEQNSPVAQMYRPAMFLKMRLYFQKQPDKSWLIDRAELIEIDRQPISWRRI